MDIAIQHPWFKRALGPFYPSRLFDQFFGEGLFEYDLLPFLSSTISPYYRQSLFRTVLDSGVSEVRLSRCSPRGTRAVARGEWGLRGPAWSGRDTGLCCGVDGDGHRATLATFRPLATSSPLDVQRPGGLSPQQSAPAPGGGGRGSCLSPPCPFLPRAHDSVPLVMPRCGPGTPRTAPRRQGDGG